MSSLVSNGKILNDNYCFYNFCFAIISLGSLRLVKCLVYLTLSDGCRLDYSRSKGTQWAVGDSLGSILRERPRNFLIVVR